MFKGLESVKLRLDLDREPKEEPEGKNVERNHQ